VGWPSMEGGTAPGLAGRTRHRVGETGGHALTWWGMQEASGLTCPAHP